MNVPLIAPLTPDATASTVSGPSVRTTAHSALPVIELHLPASSREQRWTYGFRRVDQSGRLMDKSIVAALGWLPGMRLHGAVIEGGVRLNVCESGKNRITNERDLRLAARTRRALSIAPGDQVLLVADAQQKVLTVLPLRTVDRLVGEACDANLARLEES
ncbi:hypothetical protein [Nocardia noduli]|uniref:hypothetical protein n=1 Tax=Nocardia noduli TaxID=2815722 RepID=UPI001C2287EE|nr:hypothetical protein [Nocardia noduli]